MDIHQKFINNLSTYLPNELVNICNDYLLKYVCYECYKPLLKYDCDNYKWIKYYEGTIYDRDIYDDYVITDSLTEEINLYLCNDCTNIYIECDKCLEYCRFISFCGLYYKDGNDIYITNSEKHRKNPEYKNIKQFFDECEEDKFYIEEQNMKYVKINNNGLYCCLTGPDGGYTHYWKCDFHNELFELTDK